MKAEVELLMGAKIRVQTLYHLRHKAGKCPWIHSGGKVSQSSSIDVSAQSGREKNAPVCVCLHGLNTRLAPLLYG